jgi:hypothetical protein
LAAARALPHISQATYSRPAVRSPGLVVLLGSGQFPTALRQASDSNRSSPTQWSFFLPHLSTNAEFCWMTCLMFKGLVAERLTQDFDC